MEDEPIVISSGLVVTPESVAGHSFNTTFRGYNPDEVRAFLKRVADELATAAGRQAELRRALQDALARAAHPEVDEGVLTQALGDHAARLIASAREQAAEILGEAEQLAMQLRSDVEEKAGRLRREAETIMARRVDEAEAVTSRLREAAEAEAAALREQSRSEAEAEVRAAQARGKEMVNEARMVRERMLSDLARRKRAMELQIEQLRAGRDRLAEAYTVVRRTLEAVDQELEAVEPEARMAAEAVARRAVESDIPDVIERGDSPVPGLPSPVGGGAPPAGAGRGSPGFSGLTLPPLDLSGPAMGLTPPTRRPQAVAEIVETEPDSELATGETPAVDATTPPAALDDLFARIRADRERAREEARRRSDREPSTDAGADGLAGDQAPTSAGDAPEHGARRETLADPAAAAAEGPHDVAPHDVAAHDVAPHDVAPHDVAVGSAGSAGEVAGEAVGEVAGTASDMAGADAADLLVESALQQRDEALEPIESELARLVKRVLQDEHNEVLDNLRRQRGKAPLSALPDLAAQRARYRAATLPVLERSVAAGAAGAAGGGGDASQRQAADDMAGDLAAELVVGLRDRLEAMLGRTDISENSEGGAGGSDDPLTDSINATYRQWKLQEVEPLTRHFTHAAFVAGIFAAAPEDSALQWIVDDEGPCPDCDDNSLAGPTRKGEPFPTGQAHPPAHPGCRCLLVRSLP